MEGLLQELQDVVDRRSIGKGAKVAGAVAQYAAGHGNARVILLNGDLDVGIGLIVAEHDVVVRMILFDERIFQDQRFHFVGYDDGFQIDSVAHHGRYLDGTVAILTDVALNAVAQVDGLADVNDTALFIFPEVNAGLGREIIYFFQYCF